MDNFIFRNFHQSTNIKYESGIEKPIDFELTPKEWKTIYFKEYLRMPKILLPNPTKIEFSLGEALIARKTERDFDENLIDVQKISQVLFYSAGIIDKKEDWDKSRRTYPSGGARFPLEIYPIVLNENEDVKAGVYHYNVKGHFLEKLFEDKELKNKIYPEIIWQEMIKKPPLLMAISAVFSRNTIKYKNRGYRYILIEAGHMGQNIYLVSHTLGLKCCAIGGFGDDKINEILDIDGGEESVIYIFAISN